MQALLALPTAAAIQATGGDEASLRRGICGIPLLTRVLTVARRAGCSSVLLLRPDGLPESWLGHTLASPLLAGFPIHIVALEKAFDPQDVRDWQIVASWVEDRFLWLPWNQILDKKLLRDLVQNGLTFEKDAHSAKWSMPEGGEGHAPGGIENRPMVCGKVQLGTSAAAAVPGTNGARSQTLGGSHSKPALQVIPLPGVPGLPAHSKEAAREAERHLIRGSGKDTDGMYSKFNRWLSRPGVRWLARTPITPNAVTFAGLLVALFSAVAFAQGYWGAYVVGALLYFASVLFDEMDGMLARIKFRESAFGCWLETFVDYATYFLLFVGMTVGLYRQSGPFWLFAGALLLLGAVASFYVVGKQRQLATDPDRPQEYRPRLQRRLEADSANLISRFARLTEPLVRKPAFCHYLVIFTALGGLKVVFLLTTLGANLVWTLALSFNRFFRKPMAAAPPCEGAGNLCDGDAPFNTRG